MTARERRELVRTAVAYAAVLLLLVVLALLGGIEAGR